MMLRTQGYLHSLEKCRGHKWIGLLGMVEGISVIYTVVRLRLTILLSYHNNNKSRSKITSASLGDYLPI